MTGEIKLYWWRGRTSQGDEFINIGDEINKRIVEYVSGRQVKRADSAHADMLAIGSVLHFPQRHGAISGRQSPYLVWGSGTLAAEPLKFQEKFLISGLRGPLSFSLLSNSKSVAYGDPGLLASVAWDVSREKKYAWGLIPHLSQLNRPWVKRLVAATPNCKLINVRNPDVEENMRTIAACERIAATSLHGLILADSFRIPNVWLWDSPLHDGGTWKFFDYFSGLQRNLSDAVPCADLQLLSDELLEKLSFTHFRRIDPLCKTLIKAFPI